MFKHLKFDISYSIVIYHLSFDVTLILYFSLHIFALEIKKSLVYDVAYERQKNLQFS